jgi:hypothetical protein
MPRRTPARARAAQLARVLPFGLLLSGAVALSAPAPLRAAGDGLQIVTATRYEVLPSQGRVHITIDATATNLTPDTSEGRTYYTGVTFGIPAGASRVAASSGGVPLTVSLDRGHTRASVTFNRDVFYEERYRYRVTFDLADAGGAANRDVRVSHSLVAFPVWAFGSGGVAGSSVQVALPAGYTPTLQGAELDVSRAPDGSMILSAQRIPDPFAFFTYISADRSGAFSTTPLSVEVGGRSARVEVRAWDDDPEWGTEMAGLLRDGLPELHRLIGLDYPVAGTLRVEEAATSRLGEYAGIYNDVNQSITVRYDADAFVGLHEAAHIWFNQDLFRDRWINEAWAEYYGVRAGDGLGLDGSVFELTPELLRHKIPLDDWGAVGVENLDVEDFAYAATYHLAQLIADRAGTDGLQKVWQSAVAQELAYQPAHSAPGAAPEKGAAVTQESWQRLLDLLEERTGKRYDDLWRDWVVDDGQAPLLDEREAARRTYRSVVAAAGAWELPRSIRYEMSSWQFETVTADLRQASAVLTQRDGIEERARALQLTPPPTLRSAFEGAAGLPTAAAEASAELTSLDALQAATQALAVDPGALGWIGLLGAQPAAELSAARSAFESGDLASSEARATAARNLWRGAEGVGRERVAIGGGALVALDGVALAALIARRRRREARDARRARETEAADAAPRPALGTEAGTATDPSRDEPSSSAFA